MCNLSHSIPTWSDTCLVVFCRGHTAVDCWPYRRRWCSSADWTARRWRVSGLTSVWSCSTSPMTTRRDTASRPTPPSSGTSPCRLQTHPWGTLSSPPTQSAFPQSDLVCILCYLYPPSVYLKFTHQMAFLISWMMLLDVVTVLGQGACLAPFICLAILSDPISLNLPLYHSPYPITFIIDPPWNNLSSPLIEQSLLLLPSLYILWYSVIFSLPS